MEVQNICCEKFKNGDIVDLESEIPNNLTICLNSIAKKEGFLSHNITSKKISTEGGNYLATLYEINIKGKTKNGEKEMNLFVKNILPESESLNEIISTSQAYMVEGFMYKEMSKIFRQLEDKAGIPHEERYKMVKAYEESSLEAIIMENLAKKGFSTYYRMKVVPLKFVELSVQQLAKLHGLGFAIKKQMPNFYEKQLSKMKYINICSLNEEWKEFYKGMAKICTKNLRHDLKKKAETFVLTAVDKYKHYLTDTTSIRTLCHGDFRANNILMKEVEGEVTEIVPVDLQIAHHGVPANDLLYFIYGCTDGEFRKQHMKNIIELYYKTLTQYLKYFDIDVADVYPRNKFDEAMKERADYGLIIALGFYPFFFAPEDNIPDLSSEDFKGKDMDLSPEIVHRIEEIIEELL